MPETIAQADLAFTYDGGAFTVDTRPVEQASRRIQWESSLVRRGDTLDEEVTILLWLLADDPEGSKSQQVHNPIVEQFKTGTPIEEIEDLISQLRKV